MDGRPGPVGRPPRPSLLLTLILVPLAQSQEDVATNLSHFPAEALERLSTGSVTFPPEAFGFDGISNGSQSCRLRCLADPRCLGFEHHTGNMTCGLTDILLPADVNQETVEEWSTGRRRGISWLGQPCHQDADCSLFASDPDGVECGANGSCSCRQGWIPDGQLHCRPDPETATDQTTDQTTEQTTDQTTDQTTEQTTDQTTEQTTDQTTEQTTDQTTEQTTDQNTDQTTDQTSTNPTVSITEEATLPTITLTVPPEIQSIFTEISGRLLRLTEVCPCQY
ncbi:Autophagy-related protein 11 [Amphibalanus amphitrite]|uniref:Autophagy-related protein 11 n=1 Tax=Amphibalanus amphitrite TaxID=1232801 RepID=A0A6A4X2L6_AMPAM|nr:Autophagy-related protein 11 [Amphibalanus amphitrite]